LVITERLVWLHIPKTAGDATLAMFEQLKVDFRAIHHHRDPAKHMTFAEAGAAYPGVDRLAVLANLRRLPEVALSYFHHMQRHDPDEKLGDGRSFGALTFRDYSRWLLDNPDTQSYDWHLDHFLGEREPDAWLRVDRLARSFVEVVGAYHPISPEEAEAFTAIRRNEGPYRRRLGDWFDEETIAGLYANAPRWAKAERRTYGRLLHQEPDWR
jgi:hypothetical protein